MDNYLQELLFMFLALIFVVAMAWLLLKGLKGFHAQSGDGNRMKLVLNLSVGARERLVVVTYRDNEYLVGITPGGMSLLDKLPKQADVDESDIGGSGT